MGYTQVENIQVVCAIILHDSEDSILLAKRNDDNPWGGSLWEMPGGKCEPGENRNRALVREIREELGVDLFLTDRLGTLFNRKIPDHIGSAYARFDLHCFVCSIRDQEPKALAAQEVKWWKLSKINRVPKGKRADIFLDGFFLLYNVFQLYLRDYNPRA